MDLVRYIVKARPGVVGGKFEEKRPLRERIDREKGSGVFSLAIATKLLRGKTLVVNFQTKHVTVR